MADHQITISNSIRTFGPAPSTKWGANSPYTMTWGSSKWGEGTEDLVVYVNLKLIENSISPTSTLGFNASHEITNTIAPTFVAAEEDITDGSGYHYNFPDDTSNPTSMAANSWTEQSNNTTTWTKQSDGSTSWSDS